MSLPLPSPSGKSSSYTGDLKRHEHKGNATLFNRNMAKALKQNLLMKTPFTAFKKDFDNGTVTSCKVNFYQLTYCGVFDKQITAC